ncbi:MAG: ATP-binding protein, partial [Elusimicrobiota bacterium]
MASHRRSLYFSFQGLFMAVLLLMFFFQYRRTGVWFWPFLGLSALLSGSLVLLQTVPERMFSRWYLQVGLFMSDALLAALVLHWVNAVAVYPLYFLIIFGTAITRSLPQSLMVALVTFALFLVSAWSPSMGLPKSTDFWLQALLLLVSSVLMAILARDSRKVQEEQEHRYQGRIVQFERLATLGQMAGEVAHRIKGPLTTILVNAEVLGHRFTRSPEALKELDQIRSEVDHCRNILKGLLDLGRIEEMDDVRFDLRAPLRRALDSVAARLKHHGVDWKADIADSPLPMHGDPSLMQEALAAVLHNAVDSVRSGRGRIRVEARLTYARRGWRRFLSRPGFCEVIVTDDGRGIEQEYLERIFQPFFTTKGREGSGLGLSAAMRILQKHGGNIEAYSEGLGQGARFT